MHCREDRNGLGPLVACTLHKERPSCLAPTGQSCAPLRGANMRLPSLKDPPCAEFHRTCHGRPVDKICACTVSAASSSRQDLGGRKNPPFLGKRMLAGTENAAITDVSENGRFGDPTAASKGSDRHAASWNSFIAAAHDRCPLAETPFATFAILRTGAKPRRVAIQPRRAVNTIPVAIADHRLMRKAVMKTR